MLRKWVTGKPPCDPHDIAVVNRLPLPSARVASAAPAAYLKRSCVRRPFSPYRPLISSGELPPALARARYQALAAIRSTKRRIDLDVVEAGPLGFRATNT